MKELKKSKIKHGGAVGKLDPSCIFNPLLPQECNIFSLLAISTSLACKIIF
jgi:hypothetical protein